MKEKKKDVDKLKEELLKEFERGQQNWENAIKLLANMVRNPREAARTYAQKLIQRLMNQLVLHPEMQRSLK